MDIQKLENFWNNLNSQYTSGCKSWLNNRIIIRISEEEYKLNNWDLMNDIINNSSKLYKYNKDEFFNNFKIIKSKSQAKSKFGGDFLDYYNYQINIYQK